MLPTTIFCSDAVAINRYAKLLRYSHNVVDGCVSSPTLFITTPYGYYRLTVAFCRAKESPRKPQICVVVSLVSKTTVTRAML